MKATLAIALLWILCAGCGTRAEAVCSGMAVEAFGAKGDGHTDDTAAIQSAISAAATAGGGSVVFRVARYFTSGTLTVPTAVVLCGAIEGPFDLGGVMPLGLGFATGPTLMVTSTAGPFITLQGTSAGVTDLVFYYPNQVSPSASAPNPYPYTIVMMAPGQKVARCTAANPYNFVDVQSGRTMVQDIFLGAYNIGINIDHAYGHVTVRKIVNSVFWEILSNLPYPQPIDTWVLNNSVDMVVNRVDGLEVSDFVSFSHSVGVVLTDSPDATQNPRCGFGAGSDFDLEGMTYGIVISASNTAGYKFTNLGVLAQPGLGQAAVHVRPGGSLPPKIEINGVNQSGPWAMGAFPPPGVDTIVVNVLP